MCDERWETSFFGLIADESLTVYGGRFLAGDDACQIEAWEPDWREYLTEHPDVVIAAQFRTACYLGDWARCRVADWRLTQLPVNQWPPSEQRQAERGVARYPAS